jgi:hypothetical protein
MFSYPMRLPARLIVLSLLVFLLAVGFAGLRHSRFSSQNTQLPADGDTGTVVASAPEASPPVVKAAASVSASAQPMSSDLMCFAVDSVHIPSWQSANFLEATKQLKAKVLRIPGGELANYWDWKRGGIIENDSQLPDGLPEYMRYDARSYTSSKVADYSASFQSTNTRALFVLNMLTSELSEQIDMLSAAARSGMEVKYIELGNEYYFGIPNYVDKFPTPESYGETAKVWIGYLRDIFPGVKISVFGVAAGPNSSPREVQWNQALLKTALPVADAIALHVYVEPGLDPNGFSTQGYPAFDERDFATIFGEPFRRWSQMQDFESFETIPADKEIWITEFNLMEDIFGNNYNSGRRPRVMGTWGHGLYALSMNLMFLEEPRVKMTCNHDLVQDFRFGAILPNENSFRVSDTQNFPVTPMTLSATGQALQLLGETTENMTQARRMNFANSPNLTGKDGYSYPALYGWQFDSARKTAAEGAPPASAPPALGSIVLNLSDSIVQLDLAGMDFENAKYQQLSADPRTLVTNESSLKSQQGVASAAVALPPHSVTQLVAQ